MQTAFLKLTDEQKVGQGLEENKIEEVEELSEMSSEEDDDESYETETESDTSINYEYTVGYTYLK
jgi:hypothetical protein